MKDSGYDRSIENYAVVRQVYFPDKNPKGTPDENSGDYFYIAHYIYDSNYSPLPVGSGDI